MIFKKREYEKDFKRENQRKKKRTVYYFIDR